MSRVLHTCSKPLLYRLKIEVYIHAKTSTIPFPNIAKYSCFCTSVNFKLYERKDCIILYWMDHWRNKESNFCFYKVWKSFFLVKNIIFFHELKNKAKTKSRMIRSFFHAMFILCILNHFRRMGFKNQECYFISSLL